MTGRSGVTAIIPVKPWALSKSRLDVGDAARETLARAFALDVIETATASTHVGQIVIVTAEIELSVVASRMGAVVVPDRPLMSVNALNVAIDLGRRWALMKRRDSPVVVVPADLPTLTSTVLDETLDLARPYPAAFVPDASDHGTSLVHVQSALDLHTSYGENSASRHAASGFRRIVEADRRARWDVDTVVDLSEARQIGVGTHTVRAIEQLLTLRSGSKG